VAFRPRRYFKALFKCNGNSEVAARRLSLDAPLLPCENSEAEMAWHIGFGLVFGTFVQGPAVKLQSGRRFIRKIMTHWLSRGSPRDGRPPPAIWTAGRTDGSEHWLYEQFSTSYRRSFVNALVPSRPGLGAR
jgi:hypothetical protein